MIISKDTKFIISATILGAGMIISTLIAGFFFIKGRSEGALTVTGSARTTVVSDRAKWTGNWVRIVTLDSLKKGYSDMQKDEAIVRTFLKENGVSDSEIVINPVSMEEIYNYDRNVSGPKQYNLRQTITVSSQNVEKISSLAKSTKTLVDRGVIFSTYNPEYYYSGLADQRVALLDGAIKDAKRRAEMIAKAGDSKVGALISASSGVVQVLPENSVEVSDYGTYDTSSNKKEVMVTVKATFKILD